jgi:hypothetical protein
MNIFQSQPVLTYVRVIIKTQEQLKASIFPVYLESLYPSQENTYGKAFRGAAAWLRGLPQSCFP